MAWGRLRFVRRALIGLGVMGVLAAGACGVPELEFEEAEGGAGNVPVATGGAPGTGGQTSTGGEVSGGGAPVTLTCATNEDCVGFPATQVCDAGTATCVECLPEADTCGAGTYCSTELECVLGCTANEDCGDLTCNLTSHACEGCGSNDECPLGTICDATLCVPGCLDETTCPDGWDCCEGQCVNPLTDEANCGACRGACAANHATPACVNGACDIGECETEWNDCDEEAANGCESNALSDAFNCGACDSSCSTGQACIDGECGVPTCGEGFEDCNGLPSDGCEANVRSSTDHCGECNNVCSEVHGTAECRAAGVGVASACAIVCDTDWGNCDDDATDGCETNLATTTDHCGDCATACTNDHGATDCVAGRCEFECAPGFDSCDGNPRNGCEVSLQSDIAHCGACGQDCDLPHATPACDEGQCGIVACLDGWLDCDGLVANGCEVNPQTSPTDCGACGTACSNNNGTPSCSAGTCAIACNTGFDDCDGDVTNGCEVALGTAGPDAVGDVMNCASCDHECPAPDGSAANCVGGVCGISTCPQGRADCDGDPANGCEINTETDPDNCGRCGGGCSVANGSAACLAGICAVAGCDPDYGDCDGTYDTGCEQSLQTETHCGACGAACAPANALGVCGTGTCEVSACEGSYADCNSNPVDGCEVDTDTSPTHCGACASACDATHGTPYCEAGACEITCATNWGDCNSNAADGCETSLLNNGTHCGQCGNACSAANGTATCTGTTCGVATCTAPWSNCNGSYADGCETNTNTNTAHCGSCNAACSTNHGTASCAAGLCGISCTGTWRNCDTNVANGCEVDTSTSLAHCGACGATCARANAAESCVASACTLGACDAGFGNCDFDPANGCEANFATNPSHCSACNFVCNLPNANEGCSAGSCTIASCSSTAFADCDGNTANGCEADLRSDELNCGTCDTECTAFNGTSQCLSRACTITACTAPWDDCNATYADGCEVNTNTNRNNCGTCDNACPTTGGTWVCDTGTCEVSTCVAPDADCDGLPANGCETNTNTSVAHCGGCGLACAPPNATGQCATGTCAVAGCLGTYRNCDGAAANGCEIDVASNTSNCGSCGYVCNLANAVESCQSSACAIASCEGSWSNCNGLTADGCEKNLATDPANCGTCGKVCNSTNGTATCASSTCGINCTSPYSNCDGQLTNGCEANLTSVTTCGSCTTSCTVANGTPACGASRVCSVGSCTAPYANCDGLYDTGCETNTNTNIAHCGTCNNACSSINGTAQCNTGTCAITCTNPYRNCNGTVSDGCEVNSDTSLAHCGGCNQACSFANAGAACNTGTCTMGACSTNYANCDGGTANGCEVNTTNTVAHCGGCNLACTNAHGSTVCSSSACVPTCTNVANNRWGSCDGDARNGCEQSLLDDYNCGTCGNDCTDDYANATGGCVESSGARCSLLGCNSGYDNCDGNAANGCERPVSSDINNCGACAHVCGSQNASPQCVSGGCVLNCTAGYTSCDGNDANGCETQTSTDPNNCGTCGRVCGASTPYCIAGTCSAYDSIALVGTSTGSSGSSTFTVSHTIQTASSHNRLLLVAIAARGNTSAGAEPESVTFDGDPLQLAIGSWSGNQAWAGLYYLGDAPLPEAGAGAKLLSVTGAEFGASVLVIELRGVSQTTPISVTASRVRNQCGTEPPTQTIAVPAQGWSFDVAAGWSGSATATEGSGQTSLWETSVNSISHWSSYKGPMAAQTTTMTWTGGSCNNSAHALVALNRGTL